MFRSICAEHRHFNVILKESRFAKTFYFPLYLIFPKHDLIKKVKARPKVQSGQTALVFHHTSVAEICKKN